MKVIIMNNIPLFIYWNYSEFWNQHGKKETAGLTVRCFVRKGAGADQVAYKEIVKNIKCFEGWTAQDTAKGRRDTLETAINLLFGGPANKEARRAIWKSYLESQHGNINGTRKSTRDVIKEMSTFTERQLDIIKAKFFAGKEKLDDSAKIVEMKKVENTAVEA